MNMKNDFRKQLSKKKKISSSLRNLTEHEGAKVTHLPEADYQEGMTPPRSKLLQRKQNAS